MNEKTISVWRWEDAPEEYRDLSEHGGDEDWVVYIPPALAKELDYTPMWIENLGICDTSEHKQDDGSIVYIAAHA